MSIFNFKICSMYEKVGKNLNVYMNMLKQKTKTKQLLVLLHHCVSILYASDRLFKRNI